MTLVNKIELFRTTFRNAFPMSTAKLHVSQGLFRINEGNFSRRRVEGFVGRPFFYQFADVAVLGSENTSDKSC